MLLLNKKMGTDTHVVTIIRRKTFYVKVNDQSEKNWITMYAIYLFISAFINISYGFVHFKFNYTSLTA